MGAALELLAGVLILVYGAQDGDDFLLGGQGHGTGHGGAGALGGLRDLLGGLVDELMIVGLETDADHFLLSCHGLFLLKTYKVMPFLALYGEKSFEHSPVRIIPRHE